MKPWITAASALLMITTSGCGPSAPDSNQPAPGSGTGNGGSGGIGNGSGGLGSGGSGGTGNGSGGLGSGGAGGTCAGEVIPAAAQLDMFIMLDKSGSMNDPTGAGTKWQAVTTALAQFVQDPASAGIAVGIQYFPPPSAPVCPASCMTQLDSDVCVACGGMCVTGGLCETPYCNAADYASPSVPIDLRPGNAAALVASMNAIMPNGATPTSAAIQGAIDYCRNHATAKPTHAVIHVHVTDGNPNVCDVNLSNIYAIAGAGFNGMPSIRTYVIGVDPSLTALQGIAMAGGTGMPFLVDSDPNAGQQFLDAMNQIRSAAFTCTYAVPVPTQGPFDKTLVNLEYIPGNGGTTQTIGYVNDQASCPPGGMAWYYDDNANPSSILLCPDTCSVVSGDPMRQIQFVLGCETFPA